MSGHHLQKRQLIIDCDAPGDAADRDRDDGFARLGVDDRHVVAETVGDEELALVARQGDAPRTFADEDVAFDLAGRDVDHGHVGGVAERDIGGLAVPGHGEAHWRHVALAHAGRHELDLAGDAEAAAIDDVDLARQLGRDPELLAVGCRREAARPRADDDVLRDMPAFGVDHVHEVAHL